MLITNWPAKIYIVLGIAKKKFAGKNILPQRLVPKYAKKKSLRHTQREYFLLRRSASGSEKELCVIAKDV